MTITQHAKQRMKERCGFNKKTAERMAKKVFYGGNTFDGYSCACELLDRNFLGETTAQSEISVGEIASLINDQPTISSGWIECKDKMPEMGQPVLVCDKQGNVCVRTVVCKIKDKKYWSQDKYDVIAWQPLPQPYKPNKEDRS